MNESTTTERETLDNDQLDPGAFVGHGPERQGDSIPGGVRPTDERVAAYASQSGVAGEPEDRDADRRGPDSSDVVEGPIGSAHLRDPGDIEGDDAGADLAALPGVDPQAVSGRRG